MPDVSPVLTGSSDHGREVVDLALVARSAAGVLISLIPDTGPRHRNNKLLPRWEPMSALRCLHFIERFTAQESTIHSSSSAAVVAVFIIHPAINALIDAIIVVH